MGKRGMDSGVAPLARDANGIPLHPAYRIAGLLSGNYRKNHPNGPGGFPVPASTNSVIAPKSTNPGHIDDSGMFRPVGAAPIPTGSFEDYADAGPSDSLLTYLYSRLGTNGYQR